MGAEMREIWVEKYRPKTLEEVVGQEEIVRRLKAYAKTGNMPHLLFAGPAGTGKTTCAIAMSRDLFGEDWQANYSELNASVAPETPVLVRQDGSTRRTTIGEVAEAAFGIGRGKTRRLEGLEVLSLDARNRIQFLHASAISRHFAPELITLCYEGGVVRTSPDHSVMVFDESGRLVSRAAKDLGVGDHLVSFTYSLPGSAPILNFEAFRPKPLPWNGGTIPNPKLRRILPDVRVNKSLAWLLGLYLAEGCTSMQPTGTSGGLVFTVGYPHEVDTAERAARVLRDELGLSPYFVRGRSGFDRRRRSSLQVRVLNTQVARLFRRQFYGEAPRFVARFKRCPAFVFDGRPALRRAFLRGYMGDATGDWGDYVRYSSRSHEALIDIAWLARITGLNSSTFSIETRLIWKTPARSYIKADLVPSALVRNLFEHLGIRDNHFLRHSLYYKRSPRISKSHVLRYLANTEIQDPIRPVARNIMGLLNSPLFAVRITRVQREPHAGYVYDLAVPGGEVFWGGTTPVLLHNSDERGIDVVRSKIKDIARIAPFGGTPFKIIFLDEADNLTSDAQAALRRTMETYTRTSRFVLSANYSSRIIEPIQSRCAVFRFRPLKPEAIRTYLTRIAKAEKLKITEDGMEALVYVAQGDMRRAVNSLQVAAATTTTIDSDVMYKAASTVRPEEIKKLIERAIAGEFLQARETLDKLLIEYGLSGEDVVRQLHRAVFDLNIDDAFKVKLVDRIGEADFRLVEGSNERIQIEALLAHVALIGQELGKK